MNYYTVTDAAIERAGLPVGLYILAADTNQAQLDCYPWSMNFKDTYLKMADL